MEADEMVTMGKGELKLYMCSVIDSLEGEAYDRFCELFLTACGVVDADGNLTQEYADSPYWTGSTDGEPLRPAMAGANVDGSIRKASAAGVLSLA